MSTLQEEILQEADGITNETRVCGITQQRIGGLFTKIGTEIGTKETPEGAQSKATQARTDAISEARKIGLTEHEFTVEVVGTKADKTEVALKADKTTVLEVLCAGTKTSTNSDTFTKLRGVDTISGSMGSYRIVHNYQSIDYVVIASSPGSTTRVVQVRGKTTTYFELYTHDPIIGASCNGQIDFVAFKI